MSPLLCAPRASLTLRLLASVLIHTSSSLELFIGIHSLHHFGQSVIHCAKFVQLQPQSEASLFGLVSIRELQLLTMILSSNGQYIESRIWLDIFDSRYRAEASIMYMAALKHDTWAQSGALRSPLGLVDLSFVHALGHPLDPASFNNDLPAIFV